MKREEMPVVAVIGGGPAGLMAAGVAGKSGALVVLFETNTSCGRKLLITGAGKCNITNDAPLKEFLEYYPENQKFLYPAFKGFFVEDLERFFNHYHLFFRCDENGKYFPEDDKASSVLDVLLAYCIDNRVNFHQCESVQEICRTSVPVDTINPSGLVAENESLAGAILKDCSPENSSVNSSISGSDSDSLSADALRKWKIMTDKGIYRVDSVIIATGGLSYPGTGSNGSGYKMAESLSLSIVPTRPALVPLIIAEEWCAELTGISLRQVKTTLWKSNLDGVFRKITDRNEEILFTHFGVSGPAALSLSRWITPLPSSNLQTSPTQYRLTIDLSPAQSSNDVENALLEIFALSPNKLLRTIVSRHFELPHAVADVLVRLCTSNDEIHCRDTTKEIRKKLVSLFKSLPLTIIETKGYREAMVTAGGISTREIHPQTMESKRYPGLYFAGEVIDIDGFTGGFNLQAAFSTGHLAGYSAAMRGLE